MKEEDLIIISVTDNDAQQIGVRIDYEVLEQLDNNTLYTIIGIIDVMKTRIGLILDESECEEDEEEEVSDIDKLLKDIEGDVE